MCQVHNIYAKLSYHKQTSKITTIMKLKQTTSKTTVLGAVESQKFSIDTENGVAFDILRNKLYSNKIGAVAREVSTNSRDANVENRKAHKPIEIEIIDPNPFLSIVDQQICFRDNGIGISPDRMSNVLLKYGKSTKTRTVKQTGGFGLGAKTPFSYSDTFTIKTVCDHNGERKKYTYTATVTNLDGTKSGEMLLMDEEFTTEETGTEIIVPIKKEDRSNFEYEVYKATSFWKVKPKYINFKREEPVFETLIEAEKLRVVKDTNKFYNGYKQYLATVDEIPYDVDLNLLKFATGLGPEFIVIFDFTNAEVAVSASRESVEYDKETVTALAERYKALKEAISAIIGQTIESCTSYLEACVKAFLIRSGGNSTEPKMAFLKNCYCNGFLNHKIGQYKGKDILQKNNIQHFEIQHFSRPVSLDIKVQPIKLNGANFGTAWLKPIYTFDCGKKDVRKNATIWDKHDGFVLITQTSIELKADKSNQVWFDEAIKEQKKELDWLYTLGVPILSYSMVPKKEFPKGATPKTYYKQTNDLTIDVRIWPKGRRVSYEDWQKSEYVYLREEKHFRNNEKVIYIPVQSLRDISINHTELSKAKVASYFLDIPLSIIQDKRTALFEETGSLTVEQAWIEVVKTHSAEIQNMLEKLELNGCSFSNLYSKLNFPLQYKAKIAKWSDLKKDSKSFNSFVEAEILKQNGFASNLNKEIETVLDELKQRYPLLSLVEENHFSESSKDVEAMNRIIALVDKELELLEKQKVMC